MGDGAGGERRGQAEGELKAKDQMRQLSAVKRLLSCCP